MENFNSVPLRHFRGLSRRPSIDIETDDLVLRLPGIFGKRAWRIPVKEVAVLNMRNLGDQDEDLGDEHELLMPVELPFFATASELAGPNIGLLFRHSQRVPPVRRVGGSGVLSARQARSRSGLWLDGVGLQAVDPVQAVITLIASGAERVVDPHQWLRGHRDTTRDEALLAARHDHDRRTGRAAAVGALSLLVLFAMRWAVDHTDGWWPAPIAVVSVCLLFGTQIWVGRHNRRLLKQAQVLSDDKISRGNDDRP